MQIDPKYLRQQYSSLSDEALLAIDRSELVEIAQQCYDAELSERGLKQRRRAKPTDEARAVPEQADDRADEEAAYDDAELDAEDDVEYEPGDEPDWLDEAAEVYSRGVLAGTVPGEDVLDARNALDAAGIPCHVELTVEPEGPPTPAAHRWRVLVPGQLNMQATSILERDIFNQDFEANWKAHLQTLSDTELDAMQPETAFCGLFDRVERVTRAYEEEIARRKLKSESA